MKKISLLTVVAVTALTLTSTSSAFKVNRQLHICKAPSSVAVGKIGAGIGTSCTTARVVARRSYNRLPAKRFSVGKFACTAKHDGSKFDIQCVAGNLYVGYSAVA